MENEEWRRVPEYPRYEASTMGRLRGPRGIVNGNVNVHGYVRVTIRTGDSSKGRDITNVGRGVERKLHRLVCSAFHENPFCKETVNHIDGNKLNNRPDNLEWMTTVENVLDNVLRLGNKVKDSNKPYLTPEEVRAIRLAHANGENRNQIAKRLGRNYGHINDIILRKTWKHI